MIRTALFAAVVLAAASPALAMERTSLPAPKGDSPHFLNFGGVARLVPDGAAEPFRFGEEQKPKGDTVIYDVSKGRTAPSVDVTDPRQNPFMAQPEHKTAPGK